ncbi:hypothetical protein, partial [Chryseobacterium taichungense]|uniref:hypothetical protein n=1 Tax=Chryseobacterium taichungense TaxID=295069 RepID=UPI0028AB17E4
MKKQMMLLLQFPLLLRFSVRIVFCTMFFMVVFISSQTPFSYSDSTLFISEDSYLYVESPVDVSGATSQSGKNQTSSKQFNANKRKTLFKLKSPSISKNDINQINQACFTIPK